MPSWERPHRTETREGGERDLTLNLASGGFRTACPKSAEEGSRREDRAAEGDLYPSGTHLLHGSRRVVGLQIDAAAGVFDEVRAEAELACIERGEFNAVIRGQPSEEDIGNVVSAQEVAEAGGSAVTVVKEATVAVDAAIGAFLENRFPAGAVEPRREVRACRPLDAMHRPKNLREAFQLRDFRRLSPEMARRKTPVVGGRPVLSRDDHPKSLLEAVDRRHDLVTSGHCKRATREKVVLKVDQEKRIHERQNSAEKQ